MQLRHGKGAQPRYAPSHSWKQAPSPAQTSRPANGVVREHSSRKAGEPAEQERQAAHYLGLLVIDLELVLQVLRQKSDVEIKAEAHGKRNHAERQNIRRKKRD